MSSEGELEPEVDDNKVVTDEDRAAALELKARANKAFAGECGGAAWRVGGASEWRNGAMAGQRGVSDQRSAMRRQGDRRGDAASRAWPTG